jgi:hypothetical protein
LDGSRLRYLPTETQKKLTYNFLTILNGKVIMGKLSDRIRDREMRPKSNWKDSTLVVAVISAAGTATFMYNVVMPLTTATMSAKLEALAPAAERISKLEAELRETKDKLQTAEGIASLATENTPFLPGSVYPTGIDIVKLGSSIEEVEKVYPDGRWNEDNSYYSVDQKNPNFGSSTFYFRQTGKIKKVSHILFLVNSDSKLNNKTLLNRLTTLFGTPTSAASSGRFWWKISSKHTAGLDGERAYTIYQGEYGPTWVLTRQNNSR